MTVYSDIILDSAGGLERARLAVGDRYTPSGMCLFHNYLWHLNGLNSVGPGAGRYATAMDAWNFAEHKHPGDTNPPVGAVVYFDVSPTRTDANKYAGDITTHEGGGILIATDANGNIVGRMSIAARAKQTQRPYLGWAEDFLGYMTTAGGGAKKIASVTAETLEEDMSKPVLTLVSDRTSANGQTWLVDGLARAVWLKAKNDAELVSILRGFGIAEPGDEIAGKWKQRANVVVSGELNNTLNAIKRAGGSVVK